MAISREEIWAAADELNLAGQNPTLVAVRKAVGGGSYTTIQDAMMEWKARRASKESPLREPAPQSIGDRLTELGGEVWAAALELANARLASDREALELARSEMEASRQEAAELADQLTVELDEARGRVKALEATEAAAREEAAALRERLAVAEARAVEIERQAQAARLEATEARSEAAAAREKVAGMAGRLEASDALLARLAPAGKK
ncbi:DNA-binding protein [Xanthomonas albilineans]|uniref:Probable kfra protein n=1 Tax=Xanthomonas albilineans (strain GPE PC73 / CFBP 7063) TaxID=380358 RepID=D6CKC7_XANAP|nr:DNA-binding protein [Xanthomonas albilineans]CAZ15916.1 probable kfra protein [Xanthomonas albilineans]